MMPVGTRIAIIKRYGHKLCCHMFTPHNECNSAVPSLTLNPIVIK